jgi:hypothetical protein
VGFFWAKRGGTQQQASSSSCPEETVLAGPGIYKPHAVLAARGKDRENLLLFFFFFYPVSSFIFIFSSFLFGSEP